MRKREAERGRARAQTQVISRGKTKGVRQTFPAREANEAEERRLALTFPCRWARSQLQDRFGWEVSLREFDLEVLCAVRNTALAVSVALTETSLSRRVTEHLGTTHLSGHVAYAMIMESTPPALPPFLTSSLFLLPSPAFINDLITLHTFLHP
jgi:hypothetical protein